MKLIAIDTADRRRTTVVLVDDGGLRDWRVVHDTTVDRALPVSLAALDLDGLTAVVAVGWPGSHTGVRAGFAAALGIAQARGLPLHSVGALAVVAHGAPADAQTIHAIADAGRGGLFVADFHRLDGTLVAVVRPRRVGVTVHHVPDGAVAVSLDRVPDDVEGKVAVVPSQVALADAARAALLRPPLNQGDIAALASGV